MFVFYTSVTLSLFSMFPCYSCSFNETKFSFVKWVWKAVDYSYNSDIKVYSVFFGNKSIQCGNSSSLSCQVIVGKSSIKSYGTQALMKRTDRESYEMLLTNGDKCPSNDSKNLSTHINLVCGKYLGELEFIEESSCIAYFEFSSNEICNKPVLYKKQIPCYLINKYGYKIDLLQLQKNSGSHSIEFSSNPFVINVCADILETDCPSGTSACYNKTDMGSIRTSTILIFDEKENIKLVYESETSNCSTKINFICPNPAESISKGPVFVKGNSKNDCFFEVYWYTEFACSSKYHSVKNSCVLKTRQHTFNLSSLKKVDPWILEQRENDANYTIFLNVCGPVNESFCNQTDVAACQKKNENNKVKKVLGKSSQTILRYADESLYYVYSGGEKCQSWINRSTVIIFTCNMSASDNGLGKPVFQYEDNCTYFISWPTSLACSLKRDVGSECRIINKNQVVYDLSPLKNFHSFKITSNDGEYIQMSICENLLDQSICKDSSICNLNNSLSFGKYKSALQLLPDNSLLLNYTDGSPCENSLQFSTSILFVCSPGKVFSLPIINKDGKCHYLVTWETAYACPLREVKGNGCFIKDTNLGLDFDFNFLKPPNNLDFFTVKSENYTFQIKICSGSKTTKCGQKTSSNTSATGCQISDSSNFLISTYQGYESLIYFGGMLDITYATGQKCNNGDESFMQISFICNPKISIGSPVFENEVADCFYSFTWHTKYACIPQRGICSLVSGNDLFDLSLLSREGDDEPWKVETLAGTYYINVCRPLTRHHCSPSTAVCFKTKDGDEIDYGFVAEAPVAENEKIILRYRFDNGSCSAEIEFSCDEEGLGAPELITKNSMCSHVFKWSTSAVCTNKWVADNACGIKRIGESYNLTSLKRQQGYDVNEFNLNICERASKCANGYAACAKDKQIGKISRLLKIASGRVVLEYKNDDPKSSKPLSSAITFYCNPDVVNETLSFNRYDYDTFTYHFTMATSKVCHPHITQCKVEIDNGKVYNLQSLSKKDFWRALSRKSEVQQFYMNICYPAKNLPYKSCQGANRACLQTNGIFEGYQATKMSVSDKLVVLDYFNDDPRSIGNIAKVLLHCSSEQGSPYYFATLNNAFVFNWQTPFACPELNNSGTDCKVASLSSNHIFDLSSLPDQQQKFKNLDFYISACRIHPKCGDNAAVCVVQGSNKTVIGDFNSNLTLNNYGELSLIYQNQKLKTTIIFPCDDGSISINQDAEGNYEIIWPTLLACMPKFIECSLVTNSATLSYDLSILSRSDFNWQVQVPLESEKKFLRSKIFMNVCRPLIRGISTNKCSLSSGLCILQEDHVINAGQMVKSPYLNDNDIILEFSDGDLCKGNKKYSAIVRLLQEDDQQLGDPYLMDESDCVYHITWKTSAVWPIMDEKRLTSLTSDCKVENKVTGHIFDMNPLYKKEGYIVENMGQRFKVTACGALETKDCPQGSSVCQLSSNLSINYGNFSKELQYSEFLYMRFVYEDQKLSFITFICDESIGIGHPQLVSFDSRTAMFAWRTTYACSKVIQCTAFSEDGKAIELSSLSLQNYYEVDNSSNEDGKFKINICKGVVGTNCSPLSGACFESSQKFKNLGLLKSPPRLLLSGEIEILYENGDSCDTKLTSSVIKIVCNENAEKPKVKLTSFKKCKYEFHMETKLVCEKETLTTEHKKKGNAVAIFVIALVIAVLFIGFCMVLYSPEKRELLTNTFNAIMGRKAHIVSRYKYSKLSAMTSEDESDEVNEVFTVGNDSVQESSDEEMLPI